MLGSLCIAGSVSALSVANGLIGWKLHVREEQQVDVPGRTLVPRMLLRIKEKFHVSKHIELQQTKCATSVAQAAGNIFFEFCSAGIAIDGDSFYRLTPPEQEFVLAREIAHLVRHDPLIQPLHAAVVGIITCLAVSILFPYLPLLAGVAGLAASVFAWGHYGKRAEGEADLMAYQACGPHGGGLVLSGMKDRLEILRTSHHPENVFLKKFLFLSDFGFPPLEERVALFTQRVEEREARSLTASAYSTVNSPSGSV